MPDLKKEGYKITDAPDKTPEQEKQEELNIPSYMTQVDLSDDDKKRLSRDFFLEWEAIDKEWKKEGLIQKFDELDDQYEGNLHQIEGQQFNLHKHTTKVKIDTITRYARKAFLQSDPVFSVTPRPGSNIKEILAICEQQQEYLDYKLDEGEIPFKDPLGKTFHSAGNKGVGILKVPHEIKREKQKRQEYYKGTPVYAVSVIPPGSDTIQTVRLDHEAFKKFEKKQPSVAKAAKIIENKGLEDFLKAYPEAPEDYKGYVKELAEGREIDIIVEYEDTTYNDPLPKYVLLQNFRCRLSVEGTSVSLQANRLPSAPESDHMPTAAVLRAPGPPAAASWHYQPYP